MLGIAFLLVLLLGFLIGYIVRELISRHRRAKSRRYNSRSPTSFSPDFR